MGQCRESVTLSLTPGECRGSFAAPGSSICSFLCQYIERIGPHSGDPHNSPPLQAPCFQWVAPYSKLYPQFQQKQGLADAGNPI